MIVDVIYFNSESSIKHFALYVYSLILKTTMGEQGERSCGI